MDTNEKTKEDRMCIRLGAVIAASLMVALALGPSAGANGQPTMKITKDTTLTSDFAGTVVIAKDGVTLDCAGHRIVGNGNGRGVTVDKRTSIAVRNCDVSNFATGLFVASSTGSTFEDNVIHDNVLSNPNQTPGWISGTGVWLQASADNAFRDNLVHDNMSDGFDVLNSASNLFVRNSIEHNLTGVFVFGKQSLHNTLFDNRATENEYGGFVVAGGSSTRLEANIARENEGWGFLVDGSSTNTLLGNTAEQNTHGFGVVNTAAGNSLTGNTAVYNSETGFVITGDGARQNSLYRNGAAQNEVHGFLLDFGASENVLTENAATGNATGFTIANGATANRLVGNAGDESTGTGFLVVGAGTTGNVLTGNAAESNDANGFVVAGNATGNVLSANTAEWNDENGYVIYDASSNELLSNGASRNGRFGIILDRATQNTIRLNSANNNGFIGIGAANGSSLNVFDQNSAAGNTSWDAGQDGTTSGNVWTNNTFGTTIGI